MIEFFSATTSAFHSFYIILALGAAIALGIFTLTAGSLLYGTYLLVGTFEKRLQPHGLSVCESYGQFDVAKRTLLALCAFGTAIAYVSFAPLSVHAFLLTVVPLFASTVLAAPLISASWTYAKVRRAKVAMQ